MKNKKYHTVGTVSKPIEKIEETESKSIHVYMYMSAHSTGFARTLQ